MTIATADFRTRFPEFDETTFPDARVELFIDDTETLYLGADETRWNGKYDIAQAYLAAHLLSSGTNTELGDKSSTAGPVSSASAGGVSVSRSVVAKDRSEFDSFLTTTSYGQQFINIRNGCFIGVLTVNEI